MVCVQEQVWGEGWRGLGGAVGARRSGAGRDAQSDTPELHKCRGCERVVKLYTRHFVVSLTVRK